MALNSICLAQSIEEGKSYLIIEIFPSGPDNYYELCKDGTVWINYGFDGKGHGKWYINNDTIYFIDLIVHFRIGIGKYRLAGDHAWYDHYIGQSAKKPKEIFGEINRLKDPNFYQVKEMICINQKEKYYSSLTKWFPGDYGFASFKELRENDFKSYDKQTLKLIRNEIFARYGYEFKTNSLKKHFESKNWYKPSYGVYDSLITEIEQNNINLILELEKN